MNEKGTVIIKLDQATGEDCEGEGTVIIKLDQATGEHCEREGNRNTKARPSDW